MSLTLIDVQQIAADVVKQQAPALEVIAATPARGEKSSYTEVMLIVRGCRVEPCRLVVGVRRDASEAECRTAIAEGVQRHLLEHPLVAAQPTK